MIWKSHRENLDSPGFYEAMRGWYDTPLGERLLNAEMSLLEQSLPRRFGYHLLQIGCANIDMFRNSPIGHKFSLTQDPGSPRSLVARGEAIPLGSESVDLVLLHHALDYSSCQHQLLREASRVLIAGGHVVIIGFNPISSWGIRTRFPGRRKKAPWQGRLLSTLRLTDWLKLLDFQVEQIRYGAYSLPINSRRVIKYSGVMDTLATRLNWPTGGVYMISARKQVLPLTPIQTSWREFASANVGLPIAENISQVSRDMKTASNEEN